MTREAGEPDGTGGGRLDTLRRRLAGPRIRVLLAVAAGLTLLAVTTTVLPSEQGWRQAARTVVLVWTWIAFGYLICLQTAMFLFVGASSSLLGRARPARRASRVQEVITTALPIGVSAVMPAYNEEAVIVDCVLAMLQMEYPEFEIVVVNDGSSDRTLEVLIEAFDLMPIEAGPSPYPELTTNPVRAVYVPVEMNLPLRVIDKTPGGNKAYTANVGVAAASHPYVLIVDADSLIDSLAVAHAIAELTSSESVLLGAGGTVLPANDCLFEDGRLVEARVPRGFLAACQLAEYLRSFVVGRAAFGMTQSVAVISGALGLFRRTDLLAIGGFTPGHLGEDLDLTVRLQRRAADLGLPTGLVQVPESVLWTEVPETRAALGRQRERWHKGLVQVMREHRVTVLNPSFGRFGVLGMGYLFLFEFLAPMVEGFGYLALLAAIWLQVLNLPIAGALFGLTLLAGFANTVQAMWLEERYFRLYRHPGDVPRLLVIAVLEQVGYRQLTVWWRLRGLVSKQKAWGKQERRGFAAARSDAATARAVPWQGGPVDVTVTAPLAGATLGPDPIGALLPIALAGEQPPGS